MVEIAENSGKHLIVSVAGFTPEEYANLSLMTVSLGVNIVELNLGCPNVWEGAQQKKIASFNYHLVERILTMVWHTIPQSIEVLVKLSPFSDPSALEKITLTISQFPMVKAIVASNTFPNGFSYLSNGKIAISAGNGLAGFAGPAIKAINLGQVKQLRSILPPHIAIIGVGGVTSGQDVLDYTRAGAIYVGVATHYYKNGEKVFPQILREYFELL